MKALTRWSWESMATRTIAVGLVTCGVGVATAHASYSGPMVTLDWFTSGTGQQNSYIMHVDSSSSWSDPNSSSWVFEGGADGSAWGLNWNVAATEAPGAGTGMPGNSQFINANLAVTNNTDSYQTFTGLVTLLLPSPFVGGTLMNGSVSASVQDVFGTGAEIRSVNGDPIYRAFIDGSLPDPPAHSLMSNFSLVATGGGTVSEAATFGLDAPLVGPEALTSISILLSFELSPFDTANVLGTFQISAIPAPAVLPLLAGLGLMGSSRRRRH